jgi:hypothetical protein
MRSLLIAFSGLCFSFLGLVSCNRPDGAPPDDTWRIQKPGVQITGGVTDFQATDLRHLPGDAKIEFNQADVDQVQFDVESSCQKEVLRGSNDTGAATANPPVNLSFTSHAKFRAVKSLLIKTLIPKALYEKVSPAEMDDVFCEFNFTGTNQFGSEHKFKIAGVGFSKFEDSTELAPVGLTSHSSTGIDLQSEDFLSGKSSIEAASTPPGVKLVDLICEDFTSEAEIENAQEQKRAFVELLTGPWHPKFTKNGDATYDSRLLNPTQNCYFLVSGTDSQGKPLFLNSRLVSMHFPTPRVQIDFTYGMDDLNDHNMGEQFIYSIRVQNQSAVPSAFVFPKSPGQQVLLEPVARSVGFQDIDFHPGHTFSAETYVEAKGEASVQPQGSENIYTVAPKSTLLLLVKFKTDIECMKQLKSLPTYPLRDYKREAALGIAPAGFNYAFAEKFELRQFEKLASNGSYERLKTVTPYPRVVSTPDNRLPGWLPHRSGIEMLGSRNRPPLGLEQSFGMCQRPGNNFPMKYHANEIY